MVTPAVKREAVAHLKAHLGLSERRACQIAGADRKMVRYQSQRAPDTALRGQFGPVVRHDHPGLPAAFDQGRQLPRHTAA